MSAELSAAMAAVDSAAIWAVDSVEIVVMGALRLTKENSGQDRPNPAAPRFGHDVVLKAGRRGL